MIKSFWKEENTIDVTKKLILKVGRYELLKVQI